MRAKKHIHILAICGYTTTGLALMAKELGYGVTGSDEDAYPPNSGILTRAGIRWVNSHDPQNLGRWGKPNLVIQGNQIRKGNRELLAARKLGLTVISDSEFLYQLTKRRRRIVVCGTHGKTTTSALIAWILEVAGRKPGFRLGTITRNFRKAVRLGSGSEFVFEGDEYTTTASDRRPKFFHFHPHVAVLNNIEWDHPDVFKTFASYRRLFQKYLVASLPAKGLLVYNAEDEVVRTVARRASSRTLSFGLERGDLRAKEIRFTGNRTRFVVYRKGRRLGSFATKMPGVHNVKNCLAAIGVALTEKVRIDQIRKALVTFQGTSRRFEILGQAGGVTVVDDYAHHPTKARETIAAAKKRFPRSRILAVYVPHTYSRTKALFNGYREAFRGVGILVIPDIEPARERHLAALVHSRDLVQAIGQRQGEVYYIPESEKVVDFLVDRARPGDVVLCMSVRGFDALAEKLVKELGRRRKAKIRNQKSK